TDGPKVARRIRRRGSGLLAGSRIAIQDIVRELPRAGQAWVDMPITIEGSGSAEPLTGDTWKTAIYAKACDVVVHRKPRSRHRGGEKRRHWSILPAVAIGRIVGITEVFHAIAERKRYSIAGCHRTGICYQRGVQFIEEVVVDFDAGHGFGR